MRKTKKVTKNKVGIIGIGYVGLVTAAAFAELKHEVHCYDHTAQKIENLKKGRTPFFEPGVEQFVRKGIKSGRLHFHLELKPVVEQCKALFICVGTPSRKNGSVDLSHVKEVIESIGDLMNEHRIIVIKSTVPAGTAEAMTRVIKQHYKGAFDIVSNPEFLQEGRAIESFMKADRVIIGYPKQCRAETKEELRRIYKPLNVPIFETNNRTAEIAKYACNAFLATEISFINNIANLCDELGGDVETISDIMRADKRIGPKAFLSAGVGYGGMCFPKDMRGLIIAYKRKGYDPTFFRMVEKINQEQQTVAVRKVRDLLGNIKGKKVAILGLSFKPDTDDIRDAPSIPIIKKLLRAGAMINACDPRAVPNIQKEFGNKLKYYTDPYEALQGADAMLLVTEWKVFKELEISKVKKLMRRHIIVDGRNVFDPEKIKKAGFKYSSMGRGNNH